MICLACGAHHDASPKTVPELTLCSYCQFIIDRFFRVDLDKITEAIQNGFAQFKGVDAGLSNMKNALEETFEILEGD